MPLVKILVANVKIVLAETAQYKEFRQYEMKIPKFTLNINFVNCTD